MRKINCYLLIFVFVQLLSGCTLDQLKRAGYEALYQNQCMREKGVSDCDPEHMTYDEYKRVREAELNGERVDR